MMLKNKESYHLKMTCVVNKSRCGAQKDNSNSATTGHGPSIQLTFGESLGDRINLRHKREIVVENCFAIFNDYFSPHDTHSRSPSVSPKARCIEGLLPINHPPNNIAHSANPSPPPTLHLASPAIPSAPFLHHPSIRGNSRNSCFDKNERLEKTPKEMRQL